MGVLITSPSFPSDPVKSTFIYSENSAFTVMDSTVTVADADADIAGNFDNTSLTIDRRGGASAEDLFSGTNGWVFLGAGGLVYGLSEVTIGTYTNTGGTLELHFNANATQAQVDSALSNLTYANSSDSHVGPIDLDWTFTNAAGTTATHTTVVEYQAISDAPTAQDNTLALPQTPYVFAVSDFGFADIDGDAQLGVVIEVLPTSGTLTLSGVAVGPGASILIDDIVNGNLVYAPGSTTDSFTFVVFDDGNESGPSFSAGHTFTFQAAAPAGTTGDDVMNGSAIADTLSAGSGNDVIHGLAGDDMLDGGKGRDILVGGAGNDTLVGGDGRDLFVFDSATGSDTIADFHHDRLAIDMSSLGPIGDGDFRVEGATTRRAPGGFNPTAEVVIFRSETAVADNANAAAAIIGNAKSAYTVGRQVIFGIRDEDHSALYLFHSSGNDAVVSAAELTLIGVMPDAHLGAHDIKFVA